MKSIVIAAALAAFAFCAPASASAQQDICNGGTLPPGYTSRDVRMLCADRKVVDRNATRTATNVPPGLIIDATHRLVRGLNQQQHRRPPHRRGQYRGGQDQKDDYYSVLQAYKGPLWKPKGQMGQVHMDKQAPQGAVPCKPPGYDHIVLCSPNKRRY